MPSQKLQERIYPAFKALNAVRVAKDFSIPVDLCLSGTDLTEQALAKRATRITLSELGRIYRNIQTAAPGSKLPMAIGASLGPSNYGVYGYAIATSASLGRGLEVMVTYPELETPAVRMALGVNEREKVAWIDFNDNLEMPDIASFNMISHISMFRSFMREILSVHEEFKDISFGIPAPADHELVEGHFNCPVAYNSSRTRGRFPLDWLSVGLKESDSLTEQTMRQLCEKYCQFGDPDRPVSRQVAILMQSDLRKATTTTDVAKLVGVSERGLRRKLNSEGTSFHTLLTNYRKKLALELLLRRGVTVEQAAFELGFSSKQNFRTAFKSWFGMTINEYKTLAG